MPVSLISRLPSIPSMFGRTGLFPVVLRLVEPASKWTWYAIAGERLPNGDWLLYGHARGEDQVNGVFSLQDLFDRGATLADAQGLRLRVQADGTCIEGLR